MFPDNWIYLPDPKVRVGRIQNFKNWSQTMVADSQKTCLGLEYFCLQGDGLWLMSDEDLAALAQRELIALGLCQMEEILGGFVVRQAKAYPVYDATYKEYLAIVRKYIEQHLVNLQLAGRNGMHHYNNQDHSMMTALLAARNIARGLKLDPWKVNTSAEYHEEAQLNDKQFPDRLVPRSAG
jgi:protoporphyrinogen oxidase